MPGNNANTISPHYEPDQVESVILKVVRSLRFGAVEIVIHNGRVVQIERREKLRPSPNQGVAV